MRMRYVLLILIFAACPAFACPDQPERAAERASLLAALANAETYTQARPAIGDMWKFWQTAPDEQAQEWLDEGLSRIRQADLEKAVQVLTGLVDYCPEYAEGYNQLAFAQFLQEAYDSSEENLKRAIELEPNHFGAISGLGLISVRMGKIETAKVWIRRAVAINPFLNERHILDLPETSDEL